MRVWWSLATVLVVLAAGCAPPAADTAATSTTLVAPSSTISTSSSPPPSATTSTAPSTTTTTATTTTTTTTIPPEPPLLLVFDPDHLATVTTRRYTFSGATDPGCTVAVGGKYHASVEADGSWTLDLVLGPGRNSTTFVATDPETGLETKQAIRVYYAEGLELLPHGLGAVAFGAHEADAMAALIGLLGEPEYEPICDDVDQCIASGHSYCRSAYRARWRSAGLTVMIGDCRTGRFYGLDAPRLIIWDASLGTALRTPGGVGPGSTVGELQAVYGDQLRVRHENDCGRWLYFVIYGSDGRRTYGGYIRQPPGFELPDDYGENNDARDLDLDPATVVSSFYAGGGEGC